MIKKELSPEEYSEDRKKAIAEGTAPTETINDIKARLRAEIDVVIAKLKRDGYTPDDTRYFFSSGYNKVRPKR